MWRTSYGMLNAENRRKTGNIPRPSAKGRRVSEAPPKWDYRPSRALSGIRCANLLDGLQEPVGEESPEEEELQSKLKWA